MKLKYKMGIVLGFLLILVMFFGKIPGMSMTAHADDNNYLTFTGTQSFTIKPRLNEAKWNGNLYYSTDTIQWTEWTGTDISSVNNVLYLRGKGNNVVANGTMWLISSEGTVACSGDIRTLLDYEHPDNTSMGNGCFANMFYECEVLTSAPSLPATSLSESCYAEMFYNCTRLTSAPSLPATVLAKDCYNSMFWGCTALRTAPELPAENLAENCYFDMFYECTGLTTAPELPAKNLADYCYAEMFYGCSGLRTAPELPAKNLTKYCYSNMFFYCTELTTATELPAKNLAEGCYIYMFARCEKLTKAPTILPATDLEKYCYQCMFQECTSLTTAPVILAENLSENCCYSMFQNCWSLTTIPSLPATNIAPYCYSYMFQMCPELTTLPDLPAINLEPHCYEGMFSRCPGIMLSETETDEYNTEYRIPASGDGVEAAGAVDEMFIVGNIVGHGSGDSSYTPAINRIYYRRPTATYKVVNGTWSDGSTYDKKETIVSSGAALVYVPTGMIANDGFSGGSWDVDPTGTTITEAKTFTYTFVANSGDMDKVPLVGSDSKYASSNDNFAPVTSSGKINNMVLDFSNVAGSNVDPSSLTMTVINGSKFKTAAKVKDENSVTTTGGVKAKVNKKTLIPKITCKKDGSVTLTMEDGSTYTVTFRVNKPKAQKSEKKISKGSEVVTKTVKELFGTDIDAGELSIVKQKHSQATLSGNTILVRPEEKDSIKLRYMYLNKKYKITMKVK